jgi:hypothetical protein
MHVHVHEKEGGRDLNVMTAEFTETEMERKVSVLRHMYVYTCIHTCVHTYVRTYIHNCRVYRDGDGEGGECAQIYVHTHTHTYIHTCIHTYIHMQVHIYIHMYTHTYICTSHSLQRRRWRGR